MIQFKNFYFILLYDNFNVIKLKEYFNKLKLNFTKFLINFIINS
jgi:hypothetical protein